MDELKDIVNEMQRLSDEPMTKESYAKLLELFKKFLELADKAIASSTMNETQNDEDASAG